MYPTRDNGGAHVTDYELYRNSGLDDGLGFVEVTSYDFLLSGFVYTLNLASESMVAGRFYRFSFRAIN